MVYSWWFFIANIFAFKRAFRVDINEKYVLCEKEDNGIKYEINKR